MSIYQELGFSPKQERLSEAALYNIARTFTLLTRHFQRHYSTFGLTPAKLNVLMLVQHLRGSAGLSQRDIAERLIVSGSNVTGLIDRLEHDGLLARRARSGDRRVKLIAITSKGSALLDRLWPSHIEHADRVMAPLSKTDLADLIKLLTKIRSRLK